jgi:hypothetical protein
MPAPNDNTPLSIISDGYFEAGITQEGQLPNSEQIVTGMRKLTDIINFEQTQGLKLWLQQDTTIYLTAGQGVYSMGPAQGVDMAKPLRVTQAYYLQAVPLTAGAFVPGTLYTILTVGTTDFTLIGAASNQVAQTFVATGAGAGTGRASQGIRRPLVELSRQEYTLLSQVNTMGAPNSYFIDKQQTKLDMYIWLIPDAFTAAQGTAHLITQTQVTQFITVTETMNFPIEWRIFLMWALADAVCTGQPQAIMDRAQQRCETYRDKLENWDVEDTGTRFTPDSRSQYVANRFR